LTNLNQKEKEKRRCKEVSCSGSRILKINRKNLFVVLGFALLPCQEANEIVKYASYSTRYKGNALYTK